jgi:hypothetical protein
MKNKFLRMAGVETEQEFYDMFPTEEAFFEAYPEATQMKKGGNVPTNKALYSRVKSEAKRKFDRWPSAYGSAWLVREYKKRGGKYRKGQFGGMMGGLNPENPFAGAVGNIMQQNQQQGQDNSQLLGAAMKFAPMLMGMPPMADGGKMPAWLAEKRFKAAGNADKLDDYGYMYGGDVEMGYGGDMDYMQDGGSMEEQMMAAGRQMSPDRSNSELYSGMPSRAKYNTLYDVVRALGFNPSFKNRKKLFNDMFDGRYRGTAEQNIELLRKINSGELDLEALGSEMPAKKPRAKAASSKPSKAKQKVQQTLEEQEARIMSSEDEMMAPESSAQNVPVTEEDLKRAALEDEMIAQGRSMSSTPTMEEIREGLPQVPKTRKAKSPSSKWYSASDWDNAFKAKDDKREFPQTGVVVDRGTNQAWVLAPDGTYTFPVLTGRNDDPNATDFVPGSLVDKRTNDDMTVTPLGYFTMNRKVKDAKKYDNNIRGLRGISAFGEEANPAGGKRTSTAIHQTYNPKVRGKLYDQDPENRRASSGCINCRKPDYDLIQSKAGANDTMFVFDSRRPRDARFLEELNTRSNDPSLLNAISKNAYGGELDYMQDGGEPDGEMAMGQLMSIMDKAERLRQFIGEDTDLEPWVSSKLTMADDYIDGVADYMMYSEDGGMDLELEEDGGEYSIGELEEMKKGGIPSRYKNMGFTKVGVKKKSNRKGKKWMVLAKKGDKYKVVHGGYKGMKDFSQHGSKKRKDRFWDRMGGKNSAKAKDPFSPLYWHKKFGTWQEGGEIPMVEDMSAMYNPYEMMKKGGSIYIKPENRGKFTEWAEERGMTPKQASKKVLANKDEYPTSVVKMANFVRNIAQEGGQIMMGDSMELDDTEIQRLMDMGYGVEYID